MTFSFKRRTFFVAVTAAVLFTCSGLMVSQAASAEETATSNPHKGLKHKAGGKKHYRNHARAVYFRPQPASFIVDADSGV